jgi:hypothetical protein
MGMNQEVIENLKNFGYEVTIKETDEITHLNLRTKEGEENFYLKEIEHRILFYKDKLMNAPIKKQAMNYLLDEIVKEVKRKNKSFFIDKILVKHYEEVIKEKEFYEIMNDEQLKRCEKQLWKINQLYTHNHLYASISTVKELKKHVKIYDKIEKMLKERTQKEPLFYCIPSEAHAFDKHLCVDGFRVFIDFIARGNLFFVRIYDKTEKMIHQFSSTEEEEILHSFDEWIEKVEKQQRIKNIFEPSTFFFDEIMYSSNDFYDKLNSSMTKRFYEVLKSMYTRKEIEELAARYLKGDIPKFHCLNAHNYFFYFGDKGFIADQKNNEIYMVEKNENIQENIKKILHQQWEKEVDEGLKSIL